MRTKINKFLFYGALAMILLMIQVAVFMEPISISFFVSIATWAVFAFYFYFSGKEHKDLETLNEKLFVMVKERTDLSQEILTQHKNLILTYKAVFYNIYEDEAKPASDWTPEMGAVLWWDFSEDRPLPHLGVDPGHRQWWTPLPSKPLKPGAPH